MSIDLLFEGSIVNFFFGKRMMTIFFLRSLLKKLPDDLITREPGL